MKNKRFWWKTFALVLLGVGAGLVAVDGPWKTTAESTDSHWRTANGDVAEWLASLPPEMPETQTAHPPASMRSPSNFPSAGPAADPSPDKPRATPPAHNTVTDKLNINRATVTQLEALPGIGAKRAQAIIDYRTQHGNFQTIESLNDVKGIGDAIFQQLRDHIVVE